jgi:hypothetical protein
MREREGTGSGGEEEENGTGSSCEEEERKGWNRNFRE